jgi:HPt (histidine-containing phosphotransfer) domain-containing protein
MIKHFLEQAPQQLKLIDKGQQTHDCNLIRTNAHSLKSSSATLGAMELASMFKEIESNFDNQDIVENYLKQLRPCFKQVCHELKIINNE